MDIIVITQERLPSKNEIEVFMGENTIDLLESSTNFLLKFYPISLQNQSSLVTKVYFMSTVSFLSVSRQA